MECVYLHVYGVTKKNEVLWENNAAIAITLMESKCSLNLHTTDVQIRIWFWIQSFLWLKSQNPDLDSRDGSVTDSHGLT